MSGTTMHLRFLDFDHAEDTDGHHTFEAMAVVSAVQWPALQAEVQAVLRWAGEHFPAGPQPLDDGGDWDADLHGALETVQPLVFDLTSAAQADGLRAQPQGQAQQRHSLTFTVSGTAAFAAAWHDAWGDTADEPTEPSARRRR